MSSRMSPTVGLVLVAALVTAATSTAAIRAGAQLPEGISLGLTPTLERTYWGDDVALEDATFLGGRASLNFGRFVGLQAYYLRENDIEVEDGSGESDASRRGADVVFTLADAALSPFLRLGGGVLEFEGPDGFESEHISATLGGGVRFDLFERLQVQVSVQDVAFRSTGAPFLQRADDDDDPLRDEKTFHNLVLGAGLNFYLGGQGRQPETDLALTEGFREGLRGLSVPVELFAGQLNFDDSRLDDQTVAGARLGLNFGPYVGARAYYMRGIEDDFGDVEDLYGYGGEANFNLNRGEGFTPYLIIGVGRLKLDGAQREQVGAPDEEKWTATGGAGLAFNVTDRLRLEGSARNLLFSQADVEDVTQPDELQSNWLFAGGLRFAIGGAGTDEEALRELERERERAQLEAEAEATRAEERPTTVSQEERPEVGVEEGARAREREPRRRPETIQVPVLDRGEVYIRFGESGTFQRMEGSPEALAIGDSLAALQDSLARAQRGAGLTAEDEKRLAERFDRLEQRLFEFEERVDRRLAELDRGARAEARVEAKAPREAGEAPAEGAEARVEPGERPAEARPPARARRARGVLQGGPIELTRLGVHGGVSLHSPHQLLLGAQADLGSAFGGSARLVPDATIGVIDDFTFNANAHIEWPLPFRLGQFTPFAAAGAGVLAGGGETQLLIPNVVFGAVYPWRDAEAFVVLQGLDFFDESRLLIGLRRF